MRYGDGAYGGMLHGPWVAVARSAYGYGGGYGGYGYGYPVTAVTVMAATATADTYPFGWYGDLLLSPAPAATSTTAIGAIAHAWNDDQTSSLDRSSATAGRTSRNNGTTSTERLERLGPFTLAVSQPQQRNLGNDDDEHQQQ